ncbi:MAG: hypothetical protein LC734_02060 [Acidobacteria bacterium]|nr:hypothetical protein [Acidobacteriota bacterium]
MADVTPRSITYKQVEKAVEEGRRGTVWRRIGEITGAGHIPLNSEGNASIDLTGVSDVKFAQVERLLEKNGEDDEDEESSDDLSKMTRPQLEAKAKSVGLDGDRYTNKTELITAIRGAK